MSLVLLWSDVGTLFAFRRWELEAKPGCSFRFLGGESWSRLLELRSQLLNNSETDYTNVLHTETFFMSVFYVNEVNFDFVDIYLLNARSSCSVGWVLGCNTHLPLSISTRTSNSKSMFRSLGGANPPRWEGVVGQRSLNNAVSPVAFLWEPLKNTQTYKWSVQGAFAGFICNTHRAYMHDERTLVCGSSSAVCLCQTRRLYLNLLMKLRTGRHGDCRQAGRERLVRRLRVCQEHWTLSMMGNGQDHQWWQTTGPSLSPPGTSTTSKSQQSEHLPLHLSIYSSLLTISLTIY